MKHQYIYAKSHAFKINKPQKKFIIQQLISNFADFWQKNNVLTQNGLGLKKLLASQKRS